MPAGRVAMRRVREVLRLGFGGISKHEIARRTGLAASTVRETIARFKAAGLDWPLPDAVNDSELEAKLYKNAGTKQGHRRHAEPDWASIHRELRRKHVTLSILWDEYVEQRPDGYRYSRFCELYRAWEGKLSVTMRQAHAGGDKLFVDYAGDTAPVVIDRLTGEVREAQIFVAVLGASNFTYAEATWTQGLSDWIGAHTRALEAIGGVPRLIVPDNTKTAVIKSCLYDPAVNRTYTEMAAHYDTAILPTRPRKPRDKAKVEAAVLHHGALDTGPASQSALLWLGSVERGHPRVAGPSQRSTADPAAWRDASSAPRRARPPRAEAFAGRALCVRRVARPSRRHRLSRRHRSPLLQRALSLRARRRRGPAHRADRRGLRQGRADRRASALQRNGK